MYKLTVVVAAYNVQEYIGKCLDSLVNQTYKDMEILIVNDGSRDKTEVIVREFEKKYKNIKLLNKENGGLSSARNYGIKFARGEYIAFVDGDDYLDEETYEKVMTKLIDEKVDLAIFSYKKVFGDKYKKIRLNKKLYVGSFLKKLFSKSDEASIVVWNKIFKKDIITENNVYFENRAYFEDTGFIFRYLYFVNKITIVEETLYYYIQHTASLTKKFDFMIIESAKNTYNLIKEFYKERNIYLKYYKEIEDMKLRMDIYIYRFAKKNKYRYEFEISLKDIVYSKIPIKHKMFLLLNRINYSMKNKFLFKD